MEQVLEKISTEKFAIESDETLALLDEAFLAKEQVSHDKIMETLSYFHCHPELASGPKR